jgi:hypothetical protein
MERTHLQGIRSRQRKKIRLAALTTSAASAKGDDDVEDIDKKLKDLMVCHMQFSCRFRTEQHFPGVLTPPALAPKRMQSTRAYVDVSWADAGVNIGTVFAAAIDRRH